MIFKLYDGALINIDDIAYISKLEENCFPYYTGYSIVLKSLKQKIEKVLEIELVDCKYREVGSDISEDVKDIRDLTCWKEFKYNYLRLVETFKEENASS